MAIKIDFDKVGNPISPTLCIATKSGKILGGLNALDIEVKDSFMNYPEISFNLYKELDNEKNEPLWDEVLDLRLIYCEEWNTFFELKQETSDSAETIKTVSCIRLSDSELSQILLFNIEVNTENDIARPDYEPTIFYDKDNHNSSLLHRITSKAPHYEIVHVDSTIANIQRTFNFDDISIRDSFSEISEEINCLIETNSYLENEKIKRTISAYDLLQNCNDCGHRGEFSTTCPKCGSSNIKYGYGKDTGIFVTSDYLSDQISLSVNTDKTKNCFKLEAGDDLMTDTIRACNPTGTDYLWKFSELMKMDMSDELREKLNSYDEKYYDYQNSYSFNLGKDIVDSYNSLINKYKVFNNELSALEDPIIAYPNLMGGLYDVIDFSLYLESSLMPSVEIDRQTAQDQVNLITQVLESGNNTPLSPIGVNNIKSLSLASANNAVVGAIKTIVDPRFQIKVIDGSELTDNGTSKVWKGKIQIKSFSDEEDLAETPVITLIINDNLETYTKQKLDKLLSNKREDNFDIVGLFRLDLESFSNELREYSLNRLVSFESACQGCIDIMIAQGIADKETWADKNPDLYAELYVPYLDKLDAIRAEIKLREDELNIIDDVREAIVNVVNQVQNELNLENYLGEELWHEFASYRRESKYSNTNYISDGLTNEDLFKYALKFVEEATSEINKASEFIYSISTDLKTLILKDKKFLTLCRDFEIGNWLRVLIDEEVYKVRLLDYSINFNDFTSIPIELSTASKLLNPQEEIKETLTNAHSIATSYGTVQKQASKITDVKDTLDKWEEDGLDSTIIEIHNNKNEEVLFGEFGLLCRSFDDIEQKYLPEQFKLTHNIMAYTPDNWKTVACALGKQPYEYYDVNKNKQQNVGYGLSAKFVTAGYVNGSQIIGGEIYSQNYTPTSGTYMNLNDGTFSWAGGKLIYDNEELSITGNITATSGNIGGCDISDGVLKIGNTNIGEKLTSDSIDAESIEVSAANITGTLVASQIDATDLKVKAANIDGKLTASQINANGLIAENISGSTIDGKTIKGGNINIGNGTFTVSSDGIMKASSGTFGGSLDAASGTFKGTLSAVSGTFTSLSAGKSSFTNNQIIIDASYLNSNNEEVSKGSVYIGRSGITGWEDITIRPSSDNIGNIGTADRRWDTIYVKNGAIQSSDRNCKTDIVQIDDRYEKFFDLLCPVTFKFIDSSFERDHCGFISQDVEMAIQDAGLDTKNFAGFCKTIKRNDDGSPSYDINGNQEYIYSLRYTEFIALNTFMIQKLRLENQELRTKLESLEEKMK